MKVTEMAAGEGLRTRKLLLAALFLAGALLLPMSAKADQIAVTPPAIPGAPALPGPPAPAATQSPNMTILTSTPDQGLPGSSVAFTAKGLPANKDVSIVWMTANVTYILDPRPDSVDYIGEKADKLGVVLASGKTDADGGLSIAVPLPQDYGGLHDVYVVADGVQLAKGGFLLQKSISISPTSGPIGTPITITVSGLGSPTYERGGAVLWDNRFAGAFAGNWTRGLAVFQIRAAGPVGRHTVDIRPSSHTVSYLNIEQSPVPWQIHKDFTFTVTKDNGPPATRVDWPANVKPTISATTTFAASNLVVGSAAAAKLDPSSGTVLSKVNVTAAGLTPNAPVDLEWASVVGNRVNCAGTCWSFVQLPLGNAATAADGTLSTSITIPDNLGGWHVVQLLQGGKIQTQVPYYVKRSFVDTSPLKVRAGQHFTVHLKGVGWTQLDNTLAVDYDNSYIGYGCGFNSNGDVVLNLTATGAPGTHLIDLYPLLYTQSPTYAYMPLAMVPLLSYAKDAPGLAAGYQIPAFRLAITVVK